MIENGIHVVRKSPCCYIDFWNFEIKVFIGQNFSSLNISKNDGRASKPMSYSKYDVIMFL
jgi:hypothetical protein